MKYLLDGLLHVSIMEMPMTEYPLFHSVLEIKDNMLGVVRRSDAINNFKN